MAMSLRQAFRNKLIESVANTIDKKWNAADLAVKLDAALDSKLGDGTSEKIQHGLVTDVLLEFMAGVWAEDAEALNKKVDEWLKLRRTKK